MQTLIRNRPAAYRNQARLQTIVKRPGKAGVVRIQVTSQYPADRWIKIDRTTRHCAVVRELPCAGAAIRCPWRAGGAGPPAESGDLHTRKVLDLTIRLAEVMLSSGSGTAWMSSPAQDVAQAYQLTDCVVDITVTTIIVSALATTDTPPVTIMRSVRTRSTDYSWLAEPRSTRSADNLRWRRSRPGSRAMDSGRTAPRALDRGRQLRTRRRHVIGGTWLTCVLAAVTSGVIVDWGC